MSVSDPIKLGVAGLGRGFMLSLPSLRLDKHVQMIACAAPRQTSRDTFSNEFNGTSYANVKQLCEDPNIEAVYIATPHHLHRDHAILAAKNGKHVIVEKPLAINQVDADAIVMAAENAGIYLITGPSHSFDQPIEKARQILHSGKFGKIRMIHATNYTDFLYRPRRPEELDTKQGGGVVFSQAIHQIDVVRSLVQEEATSVFAMTGKWDPTRPTEGAYSCIINFTGGSFANLTYSGYAHYDSDSTLDWIGELGYPKDRKNFGKARAALAKLSCKENEAALKTNRSYGSAEVPDPAPFAEHFGPIIVSCDDADLRLTPKGVEVWGNSTRSFYSTPPLPTPRTPVFKAMYDAVRSNKPPLQAGRWGAESLKICHAILKSAETNKIIELI